MAASLRLPICSPGQSFGWAPVAMRRVKGSQVAIKSAKSYEHVIPKKHAFQSWKAAGQSKRHPQLLHCLEFNGHGEVDPCAGEDGQEFDAELLHGEPSSKFRNPTRKLL